jgi:hypothetical protein
VQDFDPIYIGSGARSVELVPFATFPLGDPHRIASVHSGTVVGFVGSETWITRYLSGCVLLGLREIA